MKLNISRMSYKEIESELANSSVAFDGFTRRGDDVFAQVYAPVEMGVTFLSYA